MSEPKAKVLDEKALMKAREEEISTGLMRFAGRTRWEPCTEETPADALARKEGMPLQAIAASDCLDEWGTRNETVRRLFEYLAQDGPHPVEVLRRVYAVGSHMGISPFSELTLREKALIFGDSHEGHRWLLKKLCVNPLRRRGAKSIKAPGQKTAAASIAASKCQQGNTNRAAKGNGHKANGQKLNGHKLNGNAAGGKKGAH